MLERYFLRPQTLDRIRSSWIGPAVEKYVTWLAEKKYAARVVFARVPIAMDFGRFAKERGATSWEQLPEHIDAFVEDRVRRLSKRRKTKRSRARVTGESRLSPEQMLRLVLPQFVGKGRRRNLRQPFADDVPGYLEHLRDERGITEGGRYVATSYLLCFEAFLRRVGVALRDVSPAVLSAFVVHRRAQGVTVSTIAASCGAVRGLLHYAHREGVLRRDLAASVESPLKYKLSALPRSIAWEDVTRVLENIDRRAAVGKRDFAIAMLLITYGLRAGEVAALTLDDIDWKNERLRIPSRKAGNASAFPLSAAVGGALLDYLKHGRGATAERRVFLRAVAPAQPLGPHGITSRAAFWLKHAGVHVPRPGAHTFRHTCVQRLVDARVPFKTISDYVGHRSPASTGIYAKVDVESLRELALGDGEAALS